MRRAAMKKITSIGYCATSGFIMIFTIYGASRWGLGGAVIGTLAGTIFSIPLLIAIRIALELLRTAPWR